MNEARSGFWDTLRRIPPVWIRTTAVVLLLAIAWATSDGWAPGALEWLAGASAKEGDKADKPAGGKPDSIQISEQGKRNLGLNLGRVQTGPYSRKITVPAMVVSLPGRTRFQIAAPLTGIVVEIAIVRGQSIWSDELLFRMRLSHEDLVRAQTDFLRTIGQLAAETKEIARLKKVAGGAVAGRLVLAREYERDKLNAVMRAQEEALLLHGLTSEQVQTIKTKKTLTRQLVVRVPRLHKDHSLHFDRDADQHAKSSGTRNTTLLKHEVKRHQFIVEQLPVHIGQAVKVGDTLCVLADYRKLYIEGRAFERDADELVDAATKGRKISAIPEGETISPAAIRALVSNKVPSLKSAAIPSLEIVYVENTIEAKSRAVHFYVALDNESSEVTRQGRTYLNWKYRPGQRMQLRVPVETWDNVIVLPVDAVVQEGPESYVFLENGKSFKRHPVVVKYRDQFDVVIERDLTVTSLRVALNGAHQLLMALKGKSGGAPDPHAGHSH